MFRLNELKAMRLMARFILPAFESGLCGLRIDIKEHDFYVYVLRQFIKGELAANDTVKLADQVAKILESLFWPQFYLNLITAAGGARAGSMPFLNIDAVNGYWLGVFKPTWDKERWRSAFNQIVGRQLSGLSSHGKSKRIAYNNLLSRSLAAGAVPHHSLHVLLLASLAENKMPNEISKLSLVCNIWPAQVFFVLPTTDAVLVKLDLASSCGFDNIGEKVWLVKTTGQRQLERGDWVIIHHGQVVQVVDDGAVVDALRNAARRNLLAVGQVLRGS